MLFHLHDGNGRSEAESGKIGSNGVPAEDRRKAQDSNEDGDHHLERGQRLVSRKQIENGSLVVPDTSEAGASQLD